MQDVPYSRENAGIAWLLLVERKPQMPSAISAGVTFKIVRTVSPLEIRFERPVLPESDWKWHPGGQYRDNIYPIDAVCLRPPRNPSTCSIWGTSRTSSARPLR